MLGSIADLLKQSIPPGGKTAAENALRTAGQMTAALRPLPDFLIIGTKRGGTTSLWNYLLQHPGVLPMFPRAQNMKSPHYFYWHYDRGPNWYRSHFASIPSRRIAEWRSGGAAITGEASPNYLYDPRVPARVQSLLPSAKVIMLLRDPVERSYSHYKERVRAGVEPLSFEDALAAEPERLAGEAERIAADPFYYSRSYDWHAYRDRGVYAPQVQRWQAAVAERNLLILRSEDFYEAPAAVYLQVTDFLGLPRMPLMNAKRFNYQPAKDMHDETRTDLTRFFAPHNSVLETHLGRALKWT